MADADTTAASRFSYSALSSSACRRHFVSASATARRAASAARSWRSAMDADAAEAVRDLTGAAATRMQRSANLRVERVSVRSMAMGPMVAMTHVSALPPRQRERSLVSLESRKGTWTSAGALPLVLAASESLAMTLPRAAREELMARASSRRAPLRRGGGRGAGDGGAGARGRCADRRGGSLRSSGSRQAAACLSLSRARGSGDALAAGEVDEREAPDGGGAPRPSVAHGDHEQGVAPR